MDSRLFLLKAFSVLTFVFVGVNFVFHIVAEFSLWHPLLYISAFLLSYLLYQIKKRRPQKVYLVGMTCGFLALAVLGLDRFSSQESLWVSVAYALVYYVFAAHIGWTEIRVKEGYGQEVEVFKRGAPILAVMALIMVLKRTDR